MKCEISQKRIYFETANKTEIRIIANMVEFILNRLIREQLFTRQNNAPRAGGEAINQGTVDQVTTQEPDIDATSAIRNILNNMPPTRQTEPHESSQNRIRGVADGV